MSVNQPVLVPQIESAIRAAFDVSVLQFQNESHMHSGPAAESHFKLTLVTADFDGVSKVKCHQKVYQALAGLMPQFHALALHTFSPDEWQKTPEIAESPVCQGGGKTP